jgi:hypothetical protein
MNGNRHRGLSRSIVNDFFTMSKARENAAFLGFLPGLAGFKPAWHQIPTASGDDAGNAGRRQDWNLAKALYIEHLSKAGMDHG